MQSIFPIQSRDFSVLTHIESDSISGTIHVISSTVSDNMVPETEEHIRGKIILYGWSFQAMKNEQGQRTGVKITFISHMDLSGTIPLPSSIVRLLTSEVPSSVLRVQQFMQTIGCPPYIRRVAGKVIHEDFDIDTCQYNMSYIAKHSPSKQHQHNEQNWCTDIRVHPSIFKHGFIVTMNPHLGVKSVLRPDNSGVRIYTENESLNGTIIYVNISAKPPPPPQQQVEIEKEREQQQQSSISEVYPNNIKDSNDDDLQYDNDHQLDNHNKNEKLEEANLKRISSIHPLSHSKIITKNIDITHIDKSVHQGKKLIRKKSTLCIYF